MIPIPILAKICHEAVRSYKEASNDFTMVAWEHLPHDQQEAAKSAVIERLRSLVPNEQNRLPVEQELPDKICYVFNR